MTKDFLVCQFFVYVTFITLVSWYNLKEENQNVPLTSIEY